MWVFAIAATRPTEAPPGLPPRGSLAADTSLKLGRALPTRSPSCSAFSVVRTEEITRSHQRNGDVLCLPPFQISPCRCYRRADALPQSLGTASPSLSQAPWRSLYRESSHVSYRLIMAKAALRFSSSNSPPLISLRAAYPHLLHYQNLDTFPQIWFLNCDFPAFFPFGRDTPRSLLHVLC